MVWEVYVEGSQVDHGLRLQLDTFAHAIVSWGDLRLFIFTQVHIISSWVVVQRFHNGALEGLFNAQTSVVVRYFLDCFHHYNGFWNLLHYARSHLFSDLETIDHGRARRLTSEIQSRNAVTTSTIYNWYVLNRGVGLQCWGNFRLPWHLSCFKLNY